MKRLLITGGSGFLGWRLTQIAETSGAWDVCPTYLSNPVNHPNGLRLDLCDRSATENTVRELLPDVIIHQAVSNRNADHVAAIVPAARNIMEAAVEHNTRLIHVSSDMVWGGDRAPYSDDDPPAPLTPYAAAKASAEDLLRSAMPDKILIVRPSLLYGFGPIDRQTQWIVDGIRRNEPVRLFTDEIRCPIWVDTVSHALLELAASERTGCLNLGGPPLNRWDFGMKMLACLGLEPGPNVVRSAIAESGMNRPADLTLDVSKARRWLKTPLLSVEQAFTQYN